MNEGQRSRISNLFSLRWDFAAIVFLLVMGIVCFVLAAIYFPNSGPPLPAPGWVAIVFGVLLCLVFAAMGIESYMITETDEVVTADHRVTCSRWGPTLLENVTWTIDPAALRRVGIPDRLIPAKFPEAEKDPSGAHVPLYFQALGGKTGLGFITKPDKGVLVFGMGQIAALGHSRKGSVFFTPRVMIPVPHGQVPYDWITQLRNKVYNWKDDETPVYVLGDRDPNFDDYVRSNRTEFTRILDNAPEPTFQGLGAVTWAMMFFGAQTHRSALLNENKELIDANQHHARTNRNRAMRDAQVSGSAMSSLPPSYGPGSTARSDFDSR